MLIRAKFARQYLRDSFGGVQKFRKRITHTHTRARTGGNGSESCQHQTEFAFRVFTYEHVLITCPFAHSFAHSLTNATHSPEHNEVVLLAAGLDGWVGWSGFGWMLRNARDRALISSLRGCANASPFVRCNIGWRFGRWEKKESSSVAAATPPDGGD